MNSVSDYPFLLPKRATWQCIYSIAAPGQTRTLNGGYAPDIMHPPKLSQPEEAAMAATAETKAEMTKAQDAGANGPVVVDLGKKRRRQIKKLRRGEGKLMDEINHLVEEL